MKMNHNDLSTLIDLVRKEIRALEELDDVEKVYTNLNITDEMFESYAAQE